MEESKCLTQGVNMIKALRIRFVFKGFLYLQKNDQPKRTHQIPIKHIIQKKYHSLSLSSIKSSISLINSKKSTSNATDKSFNVGKLGIL